ncbi:MAG: hypothetical protein CVV44_20875 [Spirochaetae bacterium HGW-Spirochaetae-1]|nr:MAG: hypothetical protein CVV44_20875 [Spirochaetae bacterium HGW-Spirochaetae-1]
MLRNGLIFSITGTGKIYPLFFPFFIVFFLDFFPFICVFFLGFFFFLLRLAVLQAFIVSRFAARVFHSVTAGLAFAVVKSLFASRFAGHILRCHISAESQPHCNSNHEYGKKHLFHNSLPVDKIIWIINN